MLKIHYQTFGSGKPIVLIHGWAMHSAIWRDFAQVLAQHYQVTCVDLPGHGHSEKIASFTLEQVSDALVNAVPNVSCSWLGWSLGATVALDIAKRYPDRVDALVLMAGNPHFTGREDWCGMRSPLLDQFAENLANDCQATLLRFLAIQVMGLPDAKTMAKTLKTALLERPAPDAETLHGGLNILKHTDLRPALANLSRPLSVILGNKDSLVPVAVSEQIQALQPSAQINVIDKAAHTPFISHQETVVDIITRFMDEHVPG